MRRTPVLAVGLSLALAACSADKSEPQASSTDAATQPEAPPPAEPQLPPTVEGSATLTFESKLTAGSVRLNLAPNGDVSVAEEIVGKLGEDGSLMLDGRPAGTLGPDSYTLEGFDAPFELGADGSMKQGGADYLGWTPSGEMAGALMTQSPGAAGSMVGDPSMRRKLTFLFMATTVARGPDLGIHRPPAPLSPGSQDAVAPLLEQVHAALASGELEALIGHCAFPFYFDGKAHDEQAFRAKMGPQLDARAKKPQTPPQLSFSALDSSTKTARVYPGDGENVRGFEIVLTEVGSDRRETLAFAIQMGPPAKLVGIHDGPL